MKPFIPIKLCIKSDRIKLFPVKKQKRKEGGCAEVEKRMRSSSSSIKWKGNG